MMSDFVLDKNIFYSIEQRVSSIFNQKSFEENPFSGRFKQFLAFEFEFIYHELFFEGLKDFLKYLGDKKVCFYTLSPSPIEYFFRNFKKYSVFEIDVDASDDELTAIMTKDPGDSPADTLVNNANEICWFSNSDKWAILASRDWEIGIVGFVDLEAKEKFKASFTAEAQTMFTSIQTQVDILDDMLCLSNEAKMEYQKIIENYRQETRTK